MRRYAAEYPDYVKSGLDPLGHFLAIGRHEGRNVGTRYLHLWELAAAKQAAESKRGRHSQSIEPSLDTSAAVSQSPISP